MTRKIVLLFISVFGICALALAQNRQVSGTVTDDNGAPIVGATVAVEGTNNATTTGSSGQFTLSAPANGVLVFSMLGYLPQQIAIAGKTNLDVTLTEDMQRLEQVTVIGYGSVNKVGTSIGVVDQVKGKLLENKPTVNAADALQGKVAGLQVYTSSGEPTAASTIRLHGVGSVQSGTTPLILLDGAPVDAGVLVLLNPNDIESVNILKDASATSIYGARAANGIMYVVTKRGLRNQNAVVTLNAQYGISQPATNKYEMMNGTELATYQHKYHDLSDADYDKIIKSGVNTNWRKYLYNQNAPMYQVDLSVSGGSEHTNYYVSGLFMDQKGTDPNSGVHKYSVRSNVETQANKWLKLGMNLGVGADTRRLSFYSRGGYDNSTGSNSAFGSLVFPTYASPYEYDEATGKYDGDDVLKVPYTNWNNPKVVNRYGSRIGNTLQLNGVGYLQITPVKNFNIKSQLGVQVWNYTVKTQAMPSSPYGSGTGSVRRDNSWDRTFTYTNTMDYQWTSAEKHNFYILAGHESVQYKYNTFFAFRDGQADDRLLTIHNGTGTPDVDDSADTYAFNSGFGRVEYNYDRKYFVDASVRYDASSRFGADNRGATFYAFGLMWDAKQESFLTDSDVLNALKVKVSYGTQGNADMYNAEGALDNYAALGLVTATTYGDKSGLEINTLDNPELGWETQKLLTVGVNAGLWKDRLTIEASFYNRVTQDMLMEVPLPATSGYASGFRNIGSLYNRGVDFTISGDVVRSRDWLVNISANFNYNKNRITKIFNNYQEYPMSGAMLDYAVGHDAGEFYCETYLGVDPADGKQMWATVDPDTGERGVTKDYNAATPELQGKSQYAPWSGGFSVMAAWKGISLSAAFSWNSGKYMVNNDRFFIESDNFAKFGRSKALLNRWEEVGDQASLPKYKEQIQFDSHLIENASFLRLKDLTVGYEFPRQLIAKSGFLKGIRLYFTARNLWTITNYTGYDPEADTNLTLGRYPNSRQFVGGLQLTF